ncbi:hypothetical protein [Proteiniborus sp. DW1]|uniref:hypothetical protein n=1 Tax=Proteiniborus sp. DW1 TaxID=1889883 RepID=UPI0013567190|nr:hypothetical protein [Proteiniborus sp. DW1]
MKPWLYVETLVKGLALRGAMLYAWTLATMGVITGAQIHAPADVAILAPQVVLSNVSLK